MNVTEAKEHPLLREMVGRLWEALGSRLESVVLYGSAARGDFHEATSDFNLIVVLEDLEPATLEAIAPVVSFWRRKGQPPPRLFSPGLIAKASDVFPIEFLDIRGSRLVLHGDDPFGHLEIAPDPLRLQCERELREKMMRLREGYVEAHDTDRALLRLLGDSYPSFVAIFRGCLHLMGAEAPASSAEVTAAFCARSGLSRAPFEEVARIRRGGKPGDTAKDIFSRYYDELTKAVRFVDRFQNSEGGAH